MTHNGSLLKVLANQLGVHIVLRAHGEEVSSIESLVEVNQALKSWSYETGLS